MGADEGYFGERVAAGYDEDSAGMFDPAVVGPAVEMLAGLAGDGSALEFAIGTGRIALPLSQEELAAWTGASREAVSKALQLFRSLHIVETGRRHITVLDPEALRRRAQ